MSIEKTTSGLCECGCGQVTNKSKTTHKARGLKRGIHNRFIIGHHGKGKTGELHPGWKGGKTTTSGYILRLKPDHPHSNSYGYIREHRLVVEKILGKIINPRHQVHHINGVRDDNRPENLVVCENQGYHKHLHKRKRAYEACGHANWLKCSFCKTYDDPENLYVDKDKNYGNHRKCHNKYQNKRRRFKKTMQIAEECGL